MTLVTTELLPLEAINESSNTLANCPPVQLYDLKHKHNKPPYKQLEISFTDTNIL